jgi:hypothetical protein
MTNCPFLPGDRVLAPADGDGKLATATIVARRLYKTRSLIEGYAETQTQLLVEFDEAPLRQTWLLGETCQPLNPG